MKPFECSKDVLLILRIDPNSVILNREAPSGALIGGPDVATRWIFSPIFESVGDQILKYLLEMSFALLPSMRATSTAGASRSASGIESAPERLMSSPVMTAIAAGV